MIKKVLCAGIAACIFLSISGCAKKQNSPDTTNQQDTTVSFNNGTEETKHQTNPSDPTKPTATEPQKVHFRHPLTGEQLEKPCRERATAVIINNIIDALPQHGLSNADIVYEAETEGGITRRLAIFQDLSGIGSIGPVRSARTYFNNIAVSYDAPLAHCGGSATALNGQYDDSGNQIRNWAHINEMSYSNYFFRDEYRYDVQGYSWEHTLFTNGSLLQKAIETAEYRKTHVEGTSYGLQFDENPDIKGEKADRMVIHFRGGKTTTMDYNTQDGLYSSSQYGSADVDANNGEPLKFRNVLVLYTDQWSVFDGDYYRSFYDLIGSGKGALAINGQMIPIRWERNTLEDSFAYFKEDGSPVILGVGRSYIAIADKGSPVTIPQV